MADYVDPVDGVNPIPPTGPHGNRGSGPPARPHRVVGEVVAIRRANVHHDGEHLLDATVGGAEHTELVVRVLSGPYDELDGQRVMLQALPDSSA